MDRPCGERKMVRGRLENQIIYDLQFKIYDLKTLLLNLVDLEDLKIWKIQRLHCRLPIGKTKVGFLLAQE